MGKGKITSDSLIEANALQTIINDAAALEAQLQAILKVNQEILKNNPFKTSQDVKDFQASIDATKAATASLTEVENVRNKTKKELKELTDEELKADLKSKAEKAERMKALKLQIELEQQNIGTLEKLAIANKQLIAERKKLDIADAKQAKRLEEINDELNKNNNLIKENSSQLEKQRMNVGNYAASIEEAFFNTGILKKATIELARAKDILSNGLGGVTKASILSGRALAAIPIFMLISGITMLVTWFKRTQEGADALERVFTAITTTLDVLIDRLANAGGAIMDFIRGRISWDEMNKKIQNSMKGVVAEIKSEIKAADDLTKAHQALEKARVASILTEKKLELEISRLRRNARDEENYNVQERMKFAKEAAALENDLFDIKIKQAKEEARIAFERGKLAINKTEADRAIFEAEARVMQLEADKNNAEKSALKELNKLRKEGDSIRKASAEAQSKENERLLKEAKELEAARTKKFLAEAEEYAKRKKAIDDGILANMKKQAEEREKIFKQENRENEERLENLAKLRAAYVETAQKGTEVLMSSVAQQQKISMQNTDRQIALTQDRIGREQQLANLGFENRLADEEANAAKLEAERQRKERQQFRAQRALAYIETFRGFLSSGDNPGAATGKTAVIMAAIEASLAGFYEGTENVAEALGAPHLGAKKDGYIIRVDGAERIFKPSHNQVLTPYTNDEVVDIVQAHKRGGANYVSTMSDTRIVNELQEVKKAVSNIELHIDWDAYDNRVERKIRNGSKHVITYVKGGRL
jgi:hypothetical protein